MSETVGLVVIGAGQAGLAVSHELTELGVEHVVLEKGRIGQTWRDRWESFCLVTPNWSVQLPGHLYDGDDPDGFMPKDEIVAYLERYSDRLGAPIGEGVEVRSLARGDDSSFVLETTAGQIQARTVVVCTGAYQRPHRPAGASTVPGDVFAIDVEGYRSPSALPPGRVLVVGSGQSGCQIAEELHEADREGKGAAHGGDRLTRPVRRSSTGGARPCQLWRGHLRRGFPAGLPSMGPNPGGVR